MHYEAKETSDEQKNYTPPDDYKKEAPLLVNLSDMKTPVVCQMAGLLE